MTSQFMAQLMGDPPFRADAYADVVERIDRELGEQQERVAADQHWRREYRGQIRSELVTAKPQPPTIEEHALALWNAGHPIGIIVERTKLTMGRVYEIVSAG